MTQTPQSAIVFLAKQAAMQVRQTLSKKHTYNLKAKKIALQGKMQPYESKERVETLISPCQLYDGATVLLTGGLGFLGGVVLEQLLRLTKVRKVYVLARSKRGISADRRIRQHLCSPLFNLLHKQAALGSNVLLKVQAVEGDLLLPGLGLSDEIAAILKHEVNLILHCAASVALDAHIQATLRNNYQGTELMLQLASEMPHLRSFVHVSTYFVNNHLPRNSLVAEQIYDLDLFLPETLEPDKSSLDDTSSSSSNAKGCESVARGTVDPAFGKKSMPYDQFVAAVLRMSPDEASAVAAAVMAHNNFTSTYAFGKHLTEQLVQAACLRPGLHKAIVRPALISSVAAAPYPGYITGFAGPGGYMMAYALGFFQGSSSVAYGPDHVLDLIPCDTVAAVVITAGAAAAAATAAGSTTAGGEVEPGSTTIYHAASSASYPLSIVTGFTYMYDYYRCNPGPMRLPFSRLIRLKPSHKPTPASISQGNTAAQRRVDFVAGLLRLAGQAAQACKLQIGFKAFCVQNQPAYSKSFVCDVANVRALRAAIPMDEQATWQNMVWEPFAPSGQPMCSWDEYAGVYLSGVRHLLFRMTDPDRGYTTAFQFMPEASPEVLKLGLTDSSSAASLEPLDTPAAAAAATAVVAAEDHPDVHAEILTPFEADLTAKVSLTAAASNSSLIKPGPTEGLTARLSLATPAKSCASEETSEAGSHSPSSSSGTRSSGASSSSEVAICQITEMQCVPSQCKGAAQHAAGLLQHKLKLL